MADERQSLPRRAAARGARQARSCCRSWSASCCRRSASIRWNIVDERRAADPRRSGTWASTRCAGCGVFPARRRDRDPDLADPAARPRAERADSYSRPVSAVIAAASVPTRSASLSASPRSSAAISAALISPTSPMPRNTSAL